MKDSSGKFLLHTIARGMGSFLILILFATADNLEGATRRIVSSAIEPTCIGSGCGRDDQDEDARMKRLRRAAQNYEPNKTRVTTTRTYVMYDDDDYYDDGFYYSRPYYRRSRGWFGPGFGMGFGGFGRPRIGFGLGFGSWY